MSAIPTPGTVAQPQTSPDNSARIQMIVKALEPYLSVLNKSKSPQSGVAYAGQVGSTNPGQTAPTPALGGGPIAGQPSAQQASSIPMPQQQQNEFSTKQGRTGSTVFAAMSDLIAVADKVEKRDAQKKQNEAEYYISEMLAAKQRGDTEAYNELANDPKVKKILKAVKGYTPFSVEANEKPDEVAGAEKAVQKATQKQGSPTQTGILKQKPGTQDIQAATAKTQAQTQQMLAQTQQDYLKQNPDMAQQVANIDLYRAGILISPAEQAKMDQHQQLAIAAMAARTDQIEQKIAGDLQKQNEHDASMEEQTKVKAGATVEAAEKRKEGEVESRKISVMGSYRISQQKALSDYKLQQLHLTAEKNYGSSLKAHSDFYKTLIGNADKVLTNANASSDDKVAAQKDKDNYLQKMDEWDTKINDLEQQQKSETGSNPDLDKLTKILSGIK